MLTPNEFDAIIQRIRSGTIKEGDLLVLQTAQKAGRIRTSGDRSVNIDGDVTNSTIITGDGNIILNLADGVVVSDALQKHKKQRKLTHRGGLVLLILALLSLGLIDGLSAVMNFFRVLPRSVLIFPATFFQAAITPHAFMSRQLALNGQQAFINSLAFIVVAYFVLLTVFATDRFFKLLAYVRNNYSVALGDIEDDEDKPLNYMKGVGKYFYSEWAEEFMKQAVGSAIAYIGTIVLANTILYWVASALGANVDPHLIHTLSFYKYGVIFLWLSFSFVVSRLLFRLDARLYESFVRNDRKWNYDEVDPMKSKAWWASGIFVVLSLLLILWWFFTSWSPLSAIYSSSQTLHPESYIITYVYHALNVLVLMIYVKRL